MRNLLIIDTSYFAHRVIGQLNMGENVNNLESEHEQNQFVNEMINSLVNIYRTFNNERYSLIDQIVLCCDRNSWRKTIPPIRPYWLPETDDSPIGYKEQRIKRKEESPINYDNFYPLIDKFLDKVKDIVVVMSIEGLEGDDAMMYMSRIITFVNDTRGIIFCTDGDIEQLVNDSVMIFKNVRSKQAPNGEFVMNLNTYTKLFEQSAVDKLLGNNLDSKYYQDLFSICIGNIEGNAKIKRTLNNGISIAKPFRILLEKSICGDPKDNIFSLISWLASTGTRRYRITEKHLEKAFNNIGLSLTESDCKRVFNEPQLLHDVLSQIKIVTKQLTVDIDSIMPHLKHNFRLNVLTPKNIPEIPRKKLFEWFEQNKNRIFNSNINDSEIKKLEIKQNHMSKANSGGINVLEQSIQGLI